MLGKDKYARLVRNNVRIDIKQTMHGNKLAGFAINVAIIDGAKMHDVFRVDTAHGHLHMQRFWITHEPEILQEKTKNNYKGDFGYWKGRVLREYEDYVKSYKKKSGGVKNEQRS